MLALFLNALQKHIMPPHEPSTALSSHPLGSYLSFCMFEQAISLGFTLVSFPLSVMALAL